MNLTHRGASLFVGTAAAVAGKLTGFIIEAAFLPNPCFQFPKRLLTVLGNRFEQFNELLIVKDKIKLNSFDSFKSDPYLYRAGAAG